MKSIRGTFALGASIAVAVVLVAVGITFYWVVSRSLQVQFDSNLEAELSVFASMLEYGEDGLVFDVEDLDLHDFEAESPVAALRVTTSGGTDLYDDAGGQHLEEPPTGPDPRFGWLDLNGARARAVETLAPPRIDDEWEGGMEELDTLQPVRLTLTRIDLAREPFLARLRKLALPILLLAMTLTALLMWILGRTSLRSLDTLAREIADLPADGATQASLRATVPDEAAPIVGRLNELLGRVRDAVERERALSLDVAHELRTPVAGLRAVVEVALSRDRGSDEYRRTLGDVHEVVLQTENMVERLLRLHRVESGEVGLRMEMVDLAAEVEREWSTLAPRAAARGLRVALALDPGVTVRTDRRLLSLLIYDTLENAVSHADDAGVVEVVTRATVDGARYEVTNTGSRVGPDELPRLTQRFARGDPGRAGTGTHMGLGLTLVERACEALGAVLRLEAQPEGEFRARVDLIG